MKKTIALIMFSLLISFFDLQANVAKPAPAKASKIQYMPGVGNVRVYMYDTDGDGMYDYLVMYEINSDGSTTIRQEVRLYPIGIIQQQNPIPLNDTTSSNIEWTTLSCSQNAQFDLEYLIISPDSTLQGSFRIPVGSDTCTYEVGTYIPIQPQPKIQISRNYEDNVLYPNPSNNEIMININGILVGATNIIIHDLTGQEISNSMYIAQYVDEGLEVNTSKFPSGVYYLTIINKSKTYNYKFIKK